MYYYFFIVTCLFSLLTASAAAKSQTNDPKQELYSKFSIAVEAYYREIAASQKNQLKPQQDITKLRTYVNRLQNKGKDSLAIAAITNNTSLIVDNIDTNDSLFLLNLLFEFNIKESAFDIAQYALDNGSPYSSSNASYLLGLYYFKQNNFIKTFQHLSAIETSDALTPERRDYATLMFGIALQKIKKHRDAIDIYKRIPEDSEYYIEAQLNTAVANIRQGWWTDAHVAIKKSIKSASSDLKRTTNRLLMVLAYSQLQNEFYRNARNTFRKLSLDSIYVNQALLGIGLCAMHQKDYAGALNAFSRLQKIESNELSIMEAYLLLPYTYERMGELDDAALLYSQAVAYYENKKRQFESELAAQRSNDFNLRKEHLRELDENLVAHYERLNKLDVSIGSKQLQKQMQSLKVAFKKIILTELNTLTEKKITHVQSYMSQSQYGLAKLYDSQ